MSDSLEQDGRIDSFFNVGTLTEEKDIVITKVLDSVLTKLQEVAKVSNEMLGFKSLREATDGILRLEKSVSSLNQEKMKALDIAYKEIRVRREAAAAESLEEQASLRRLQQKKTEQSLSTNRVTKKTTNAQAQPQSDQAASSPALTKKSDDIRETEARVESLKQRFLELSEAKAKYVREGDTKSTGFYNAARDIKLVQAELERENQVLADQKVELQLIQDDYNRLIALKKEFASLPVTDQKSNAGRGVRVQIEQSEKLANPDFKTTLPVDDPAVQKKIADINEFKGVLQEMEAEMKAAEGTPLFQKLSVDVEAYRAELKGMTEDLGLFVASAEKVDSAGAFKNFNQELKAAQQKVADLKVANVAGPELDRAIADLERLQQKGKEVKETLGQVQSPKLSGGAGGSDVDEEISLYNALIKKAREAKQVFLDLREAMKDPGSGISTADVDAAKAKWLGFQNQVRDAALTMKDALKANPNNGLQKQIDQVTAEIEQASQEAAFFMSQMQRVGQTQVGRNSPMFKELEAKLNEFDKKIVDSFNKLKKLSPEAAAQLQKSIPIPKLTAGGAGANFDKEIAAANVLNSTYQSLRAQLQALQLEAQELGAKQFLGIASKQDISDLGKLHAQIDELGQGIQKIDNQVGRAGRNNQAYTRQLFSLQQVLRETPSLAFGFSTFISAISNNLPILADDIKRIKDENKLLAASGQKTESVWTSLAKSFFSWQTLLLAGISILAIYSKEIGVWVTNLARSREEIKANFIASKDFIAIQEKLAQSITTLVKNYEKLNEIRNRSNEEGLRNLRNELKILEASGQALQNKLGLMQKIQTLENTTAGETQTRTAGDVANTFLLQGQTKLPTQKELVGNNEQTLKERQALLDRSIKYNRPQTTIQRQTENVKFLQSTIDLKKEDVQLAESGVKIAKEFADKKLKIEQDLQAGRIATVAEADKQIKLLEEGFLTQAKTITDRREDIATQRSDLIKEENARQLRFDVRNNRKSDKNPLIQKNESNQKTAEEDAAEAKAINESVGAALIKTSEAVANQRELDEKKAKDASDQYHERVIANAEAQAAFLRTKNEDILADETSTHKQRMGAINELARAQRIVNEAEFREAKRLHQRGELNDSGFAAAELKASATRTQIETETNRKLIDLHYSYLQRRLAAEKQELEAERNLSIKINADIQKSENVSMQERLRAQQSVFNSRKKLLEEQLRQELILAGFNDQAKPGQRESEVDTFLKSGEFEIEGKRKTQDEIRAMRAVHENKMLELIRDAAIEQNDAIKAELNRQEGLYSDAIKNIQRRYEEADLGKIISYTADVTALNKSFIAGELLFKNFATRRKAIDDDYNIKAKEDEIKNFDEQIKEAKKHYSKEEEAAAGHAVAMAEIRLSIAQSRSASLPENDPGRAAADAEVDAAERGLGAAKNKKEKLAGFAKQIIEAEKSKVEALKNLSDEEQKILDEEVGKIVTQFAKIGQALAELQDARYNARAMQIQDEMDLLDKRTEKERSSIEQTVLSEEERARRLKELDVKNAQQKEVLEKRQRKLDFDRAKSQKQSALFGVAVDLATTLANIKFEAFKGFASPDPFRKIQAFLALAQIPLAIAAAATSVAAINATPLPKYALGTKDHPGGQAVLGDAYRSELVQEPDGRMWITAARPTVYDVPEHAKVFPDAKKELAKAQAIPSVQPMATIRELEQREYTNTLNKHVESARQLQQINKSIGLVIPPVTRPVQAFHPMEHSAYTHSTVEKLVQAPAPDVSVTVTGMEQLPGILNKGFERMVSALKNQPQAVPHGSRNAELLLKYGQDYFKHL